VESIAWLRARGVDVIVLDHHQVSSPAPAAVALVNPQLAAEARVSLRNLCSVGLAFKLAHALLKRGRDLGLPGVAEFDLRPLLDLVALGTIADVVPLTGENRILVTAGLEKLSTTGRPGLVALKKIAQCPEKLNTMDVGYQLAPRLNASGRLENAMESLQLVLARDEAEATPLARNLDYHNQERQKIERGITTGVIGAVKARFNPQTDFVIVEGQMLWHIGVVGIVASRVLQQFYRPTFILGGEGNNWRGSGRSIAGFDLAAALRECDDLLVRHGGHAMAAGVTILPENIDAFRARLNDLARRQMKPEDFQPVLCLDAEVALRDISLDLLEELDRIKPTGQGNAPLQFWSRQLACARPCQRMGADKQHAKLWVTDGQATHEAVWWGAGSAAMPEGKFDLAFVPQVNDFGGRRTVQLKVLDWRRSA
jgi:single-stranded-DNA-specific exonuclease